MKTLSNKIIPKRGILDVPLYIGGKSESDGLNKFIKLSSNENPYGPSKKAIRAFKNSEIGLGIYPDSNHTVLRNTIAEVMGLDVSRIICGAGSDEIIQYLCQCYASEGDEVIHTAHGFAMYRISSLVVGATPISVPEIDRRADIKKIIEACTERTKLIFLANPNNPTGTLVNDLELHELLEGIPDHTLLVLDGAYAEYIKKFDAGLKLAETKQNVFITRTFSKIHGLGSLRIGWGYGPEHVIETLQRIKAPFNISSVGQRVATAAIQDMEYVDSCCELNSKSREQLAYDLRKINIPSDYSFANFLLLRFPTKDIAKLADQFLHKNGVLVRNVSSYGLNNFLRVSIGTSDDCRKVLENLTKFQEKENAI